MTELAYTRTEWIDALPDWSRLPLGLLVLGVAPGLCAWGLWGPG
ncbi:hypothetical protein ACFV9W_18485 [Streptomyces sp. NPDC059897]